VIPIGGGGAAAVADHEHVAVQVRRKVHNQRARRIRQFAYQVVVRHQKLI
jgi:hypothetical protein